MNAQPSELDRQLARLCVACPVCRQARAKQQGLAFWIVNHVESRLCPFCRAYERVHGRKSHTSGNKGQAA